MSNPAHQYIRDAQGLGEEVRYEMESRAAFPFIGREGIRHLSHGVPLEPLWLLVILGYAILKTLTTMAFAVVDLQAYAEFQEMRQRNKEGR
jgi:hypothetical protein